MENITLEKVIKFKSQIDKIDSVIINEKLDYKLNDDNMSAKGIINLYGSVYTLQGLEEFNEYVDVDIYAPFNKLINADDFEIKIKDYNYIVISNSLIVHIILEIIGFDNSKTEENININEENKVVEKINTLNEIEEINTREDSIPDDTKTPVQNDLVEEKREVIAPLPILKDKTNNNNDDNEDSKKKDVTKNNNFEAIDNNWSKNLFTLSDSYTVIKKAIKK